MDPVEMFTKSDIHRPCNDSSAHMYLHEHIARFSEEEFREFFGIDSTVEWIKSNEYKRVALQLPDGFLFFARKVYTILEQETGCKCFILADTTYRSCCVDEVAAQHATCDAIVHYADACLSAPNNKIPVKYVLGRLPFNPESLNSQLNHHGGVNNDVIVLTDAMYTAFEDEILKIAGEYAEKNQKKAFCAKLNMTGTDSYLARSIPEEMNDVDRVFDVLFVGNQDSPLLRMWLITFPNLTSIYSFDPVTEQFDHNNTRTLPQMRKRMFLIEKVKDAKIIGLVVGTVGVKNHKEAVQRMRQLCKAAGKKLYVLSVGKVNSAKLANFADIDIFVLLSCPFGLLLDHTDSFKKMVSFFEAEIALNPAKTWIPDGKVRWNAEFAAFLDDPIGEEADGTADVSLITNQIRVKRSAETESSDSNALVLHTAKDYFANRTWKGLDDSTDVVADTTLGVGRMGIAQGYDK